MEAKIYTVYSHESDMTFIMKETDKAISVIGFYFGMPNEEATKEYAGNLSAELPE